MGIEGNSGNDFEILPEKDIEFNIEYEPKEHSFKLYYNENNQITKITLDTKKEEIPLYPISIQLSDEEEAIDYIPHLEFNNPQFSRKFDSDISGNFISISFEDIFQSVYSNLQDADKEFLGFLAEKLNPEDFDRLIIEQYSAQASIIKNNPDEIEKYRKLIFSIGKNESLPISSEYKGVYAIYKSYMYKDIDNPHDYYTIPEDQHLTLDEIYDSYDLVNKVYDEAGFRRGYRVLGRELLRFVSSDKKSSLSEDVKLALALVNTKELSREQERNIEYILDLMDYTMNHY
jgi:hypothetical protein